MYRLGEILEDHLPDPHTDSPRQSGVYHNGQFYDLYQQNNGPDSQLWAEDGIRLQRDAGLDLFPGNYHCFGIGLLAD